MQAETLPKTVLYDIINSLCGDQIGEGISRRVFNYELDENLVLKLETGCRFQNVIEWQTWQALKDVKHAAEYLAPCKWISACGTALLMSKTIPMRKFEDPKVMPSWLTDFKRDNYGSLDGRIVCHDYGTNLLLNHGAFPRKLIKPEWW